MAQIPEQAPKTLIKFGVMHKVLAFEEGIQVGTGYFIHYADDRVSEADLIDDKGDRLPEGWYQLLVTGEQFNVVVPTREQ